MAGEVDDIVQNIVLTGNNEVSEAFDRIQEAGERAFEAIARAAEHVGSVKGLAEAIGGVAASIAILTVGAFAFTKGMSDAVNELGELAAQAGTTTEEMSALTAVFARQGVGGSELGQSFRRLSVSIEQSWSEIKKTSRDGADQLKGDYLTIANAQISLAAAQRNVANIAQDNALLRRRDIESIKSANLSLDDAMLRERALRGEDVSAEQQQLALSRASLDVEEAQLRLREAKAKAQKDAQESADNEQKAILAQKQAELALSAARKKAADDRANDIGNIQKAVEEVARGNSEALNDINASAENLAKGIIAASGQGAAALSELRGGILDLSQPAPGVEDVFKKMSEVFSHTENNALKTAIAFHLLGRSVGQDFIETLSQGPEALDAMRKRIHDLGLEVTDADEHRLKDFRVSLYTLISDVQLVAIKIAAAFGPGFAQVLNSIDSAITSNKSRLETWANDIAGKVVPVVETFIRVLSGTPDAVKDQWLTDYTNKLKTIVTIVEGVVAHVGRLVSRIAEFFKSSAEQINSVFGTNLNAVDLLFAAFFAKNIIKLVAFTGVFQAAGAAIAGALSAAVAENGLLAVVGAFGALAAKLTIVTGILYELYRIYKLFNDSQEKKDARDAATAERRKIERDQLDPSTRVSESEKNAKIIDVNKRLEEQLEAIDRKEIESKRNTDSVDKQIRENQRNRLEEAKSTLESVNKAAEEAAKSAGEASKHASEESNKNYSNLAEHAKKSLNDVKDANEKRKKDIDDQQKRPKWMSLPGAGEQKYVDYETSQGSFPDVMRDEHGNTGAAKDRYELNKQIADQRAISAYELDQARKFNESIHAQGGTRSPTSNYAAQDESGYYDENGSFVRRGRQPDRSSASGAPRLVGFEDYKKQLMDTLPEVPLPRPRPEGSPGADVQQITQAVKDGTVQALSDRNQVLNDQSRPDTSIPSGQAAPSQEAVSGFLDNLLGFLKNALTDPGAIQEKQRQQTDQQQTDQQQVDAQPVTEAIGTINAAIGDFVSAAQDAAASIERVAATLQNVSTPDQSRPIAAAGGGLIDGPGSDTSDSIHARLSRGEFVQRAAAVRHWGVDFMHAINNLQMPSSFALGGLVGDFLSPVLPRFALGGPVVLPSSSGGSLPHLGTMDFRTNGGSVRVIATRDTVSDLRKASMNQQLTSTGKKPGWVD